MHVIENSGDRFKKFSYGAPESGWPSSDSSWHVIACLEPLLNCHVLKETFFLGLGLTVTEIITSKKYRNKT